MKITGQGALTADTVYTITIAGIKNPQNATSELFTSSKLKVDVGIRIYRNLISHEYELYADTAYDIYGTVGIVSTSSTAKTGTATTTETNTKSVIAGGDALAFDLSSAQTAVNSGGILFVLDSAFILPANVSAEDPVIVNSSGAGTWTYSYFPTMNWVFGKIATGPVNFDTETINIDEGATTGKFFTPEYSVPTNYIITAWVVN